MVITKVLLVDTIQSLDISIALVLEVVPVEGGSFGECETVGLALLECFGDIRRIPGNLFGNTSGFSVRDAEIKSGI